MTAQIDVLARLAGGLCREARVARIAVSPDESWSWNGATRTLSVGERTLAEGGPEVCAGILAHEVGHVFLSRPFPVPEGQNWRRRALYGRWHNAIEDPRIEAWMALRYPGVAAWFHLAASRALASWKGAPALRHEQWAIAACVDGHPAGAHIVEGALPEVKDALAGTEEARRQHRDGFLPPADLSAWVPTAEDVDAYEVLHRTAAQPGGVSASEVVVRLHAWRAWQHALAHIFPHVERLLARDIDEIAGILTASPELVALLEQNRPESWKFLPSLGEVVTAAREGRHPAGAPTEHAQFLAWRWLAGCEPPAKPRGAPVTLWGGVGNGLLREGTRSPAEADTATERLTSPEVLVGRLERALEKSLRAERTTRARAHAHAGLRADLRRVMVNEGPLRGDPARHLPVWRRAARASHDAAFGLLIDCSGSMRGERIEAATVAASVFAQALTRVGAPFLVYGFQNCAFPLAPLGATLDVSLRGIAAAALEVAGRRPGGNNRPGVNDDGPCLLATARELLRAGARQHVLVVLSDGRPAGGPGSDRALREAVARLQRDGTVDLIGVGLGAGAVHVRDFYPRQVVVPRVEDLPERLVRVLAAHAA
jgi:hypothetical protein